MLRPLIDGEDVPQTAAGKRGEAGRLRFGLPPGSLLCPCRNGRGIRESLFDLWMRRLSPPAATAAEMAAGAADGGPTLATRVVDAT